ncbi:MAG: ribonuclease PH [Proteobacteria bacterium]|nr:ribonuclease PH [Pseudomonadota bacterium]
MTRMDGRSEEQLREVRIDIDFVDNPAGSALIQMGRTKVLCTASLSDSVPAFLRGAERGWVTAEYSLLPGSTDTRTDREAARGRPSGRSMEIQRLIGRSLRAVVDMQALGERAVYVDCDVLQADGGTRTAAITGGYVALAAACRRLQETGLVREQPLVDSVAAVSVGIVDGQVLLDLPYSEDSRAEVDLNVVQTGSGRLVEVQGTAERGTFDRSQLDELLDSAEKGIAELTRIQREVLGA